MQPDQERPVSRDERCRFFEEVRVHAMEKRVELSSLGEILRAGPPLSSRFCLCRGLLWSQAVAARGHAAGVGQGAPTGEQTGKKGHRIDSLPYDLALECRDHSGVR